MAPKKSAVAPKSAAKKGDAFSWFSGLARSDAKPNRIEFTVRGLHASVVNALRRACLAEVPNAAIDSWDPERAEDSTVVFRENTCSLHNEFLAARLALVPIHFSEAELVEFANYPRRYAFLIDVENASPEPMDVTSKDIRVLDEGRNDFPAAVRDAVFPPDPLTKDHVLIARLAGREHKDAPKQKLAVEFRASMGTAKAHAKYSTVSTCTFFNKVDPDILEKELKEAYDALEADPKPTLEQFRRRFMTLEAQRCYKKNAYGEATEFVFRLESECKLRPEYILFKAFTILIDKVKTLASDLENKREARVRLTGDNGEGTRSQDQTYVEVHVKGEDHTLGNLLQAHAHATLVRPGDKGAEKLAYVGYHQPHPLDDLIVFKLAGRGGSSIDETAGLLREAAADLARHLTAAAAEWIAFSGLSGIAEVDSFVATAKPPKKSAAAPSKKKDNQTAIV